MSTPGERMAAEMVEQEAPEWWKEILPDRRFADGTPVCLIKDSRGVVAYDVGEPEADRILADHKAGQELVRVKADDTEGIDALQSIIADLRAQLARKDQAIADMLATHLSFAEGERLRAENAQLQEELERVRATASSVAEELRAIQPSIAAALAERDRLQAQLQTAGVERERQQRVNMQMADAYAATKMAMLRDLTATTTLLDRAKGTLENDVYFTPETGDDLCCCCERSVVEGHSPLCEIGLVLAAIDDAHGEKAGGGNE